MALPRHVAIIMDGNGRWAARAQLPRHVGHRRASRRCVRMVEGCAKRGVEALTLFAFSSENWAPARPRRSRCLMELFVEALEREVEELHRERRPPALHRRPRHAAAATCASGIAARRGAHGEQHPHDPVRRASPTAVAGTSSQAARRLAARCAAGELRPERVDEADVRRRDSRWPSCRSPDLFIRTGGEQRISNFLLWHLAYTELYFMRHASGRISMTASLDQAFRSFASAPAALRAAPTEQVASA